MNDKDADMNNIFLQASRSVNSFQADNGDAPAEPLKSSANDYEQIFVEAAMIIRRHLDEFKPEAPCSTCANKDCKIEKKNIFTSYPPSGCKYRDWQKQAITYLTGDYQQKLKLDYAALLDKKKDYECNKCGGCCKIQVSECSYQQLKQRAMKGDKFAEEFVSVYVPIETEEEAKLSDENYYKKLNELVDDRIYYYKCKKFDGNSCSDYENRPDICKNYPNNPLKLLPSKCAFNEWHDEIAHAAMLLQAKIDIIKFYKEFLG